MKPRIWLLVGVLLAVPGLPLVAQNPEVRADRLRQELEARFAQQIRVQLGLSGEQADKVGDLLSDYARRRRGLEVEERSLRQALNFQLRPGIAADADSVSKLVDRIAEVRVSYARLVQDEMRELATVLTPVQRGQLFVMRDRILQQIQELRNQRLRPNRPPLGNPF